MESHQNVQMNVHLDECIYAPSTSYVNARLTQTNTDWVYSTNDSGWVRPQASVYFLLFS